MTSTLNTGFRLVFGIVLLAWVGMGIAGWEPPPVLSDAVSLRDSIFESGYVIPAVLCVYFFSGVCFVTNRYVALGSVVLFPVSLNIFLFHLMMNPNLRSLSIATALLVGNIFMLYQNRSAFVELLKAGR